MDRNDSHQPNTSAGQQHWHDGQSQHQGGHHEHGDGPGKHHHHHHEHGHHEHGSGTEDLTGIPPEEWMQKVPGDLQQLLRLTTTLGATASNISDQVTRLKSVSVEEFWSGEGAKAFTAYKEELPPPLTLAQKRYEGTSHALATYNKALQDIHQTARRAVQEATEAKAAIEAEGHQVSEWRLYADGHPVYRPHPLPKPGPSPVAHPDGLVGPDASAAPAVDAPGHQQAISPRVRGDAQFIQQPVVSRQLYAEFERFGASVKLMRSAIDSYDEAGTQCAAGIRKAIDDDLKNTAGYHKSLDSLSDKLSGNLAAIAPALQGQLGKLTGVASLLGWLPMIAAFAGDSPQAKKTIKELTKDAQQWKSASGDGKQIIDGFLKLLTAKTDHAAHAGQAQAVFHDGVQQQFTHAQEQLHQGLQQAQDQLDQGLQQIPDSLTEPLPDGAMPADSQPADAAPVPDPASFSIDAGGATIDISITTPDGLSQLATHTVPVPAA